MEEKNNQAVSQENQNQTSQNLNNNDQPQMGILAEKSASRPPPLPKRLSFQGGFAEDRR